jgi:glycosyltransferase involved in cell wall biosynthesis
MSGQALSHLPGRTPRRILHVFRAPLGGLFRHVLDVARLQAEAGHAVGLFCDSSTGGVRADQALAALAPKLALGVTRVPMRRNPHPRDLTALLAFNRVYRETGADVLHGHGSKGGLYARLAFSADLDRRAIRAYTPHGGSFNYNPGTPFHKLYMSAEAAMTRRTDAFLFESHYVADRYRRFVGETDRVVRIVQNGLEEPEFEPITRADDPYDLVYVGELRQAKGVDLLVEAVARLRREGERRTLLIVGSGPLEGSLKAQVEARGLADAVAFAPAQPIRGALARGHVMVISSLAESLPYVILEAAAAAQPMISTNVGGIPEIFGPFGTDLIPAGDAGALADAIRRTFRACPVERARHAAALSAHVHERFSVSRMVDGVLAGYEAAFAARGLVTRPLPVAPAAAGLSHAA